MLYLLYFLNRWNKVFGNNSLTQPVDEIQFARSISDRTPLACMRGDYYYMEAYEGFLEQLKDICPEACVFKSLPKLDPEETDTETSQTDYDSKFDSIIYILCKVCTKIRGTSLH